MSLRDQLVAKGLASKKKAQQAERELKAERKRAQAQRAARRDEDAAAEAAHAEELAQRRAQSEADRAAAAAAREAHEMVHRVRQIVWNRRMAGRGPVPFFHRRPGAAALGRLWLPVTLVRDLRLGKAAVAGFVNDRGVFEVHVVDRRTAERLDAIDPAAIVHWVRAGAALDDPSEGPGEAVTDVSLRPRRLSPLPAGGVR